MTYPVDVVEHHGEKFIRIDPSSVNLSAMEEIQKITDVFAYQLSAGEEEEVITISISDGTIETVNTAREGDWIVYNLGSAKEYSALEEKLRFADKKVISDEAFQKLYRLKDEGGSDGSTYADYDTAVSSSSPAARGRLFRYSGGPVYAAHVPFNFVIAAPWGRDQFIYAGGYLIYNTNTSTSQRRDIYGTDGANDRRAGQLEKTYARKGQDTALDEAHAFLIKADRSPIAGIQFSHLDVEEAIYRTANELEREKLTLRQR